MKTAKTGAAAAAPKRTAATPPAAPPLRALFTAARRARVRAHAPYSKFLVGAAVLDERGRVHAGCNVENAAYPQGLCAEAAALAAMVLAGGRHARAVAVAAASPMLTTPCGGCRQKIAEFAGPECPVYVLGPRGGAQRTLTLGELLPFGFGGKNLVAADEGAARRPGHAGGSVPAARKRSGR